METQTQIAPEKIPDFIMLRMMKDERERLIERIAELECEIQRLRSFSEKEKNAIRRDSLVIEMREKILQLERAARQQEKNAKEIKRQRDNLLQVSLSQRVKSIEPHVIF